jgi:hypothetical protein
MFKMIAVPLIILVFLSGCGSTGGSGAYPDSPVPGEPRPDWVEDPYSVYDRGTYVAVLGHGATRDAAERNALVALAALFGQSVQAELQAAEAYSEAVVNGTVKSSSQTSEITEALKVSVEMDTLAGAEIRDVWYDQKSVYYAAAIMEKARAAGIYDAKINANMSAINALMEDAGKETEALYACGLLYAGLRVAGITEEFIKTAAAVGSGPAGKYDAALGRIQQFRSAYRAGRDSLRFTVRVEGPDTAGRIERTLQELLEGGGYITTLQNPQYTVAARLTAAEEAGRTRVSIRAGIAVRIERDGSALFSYTQNYEPVASGDRDRAYSLAFIAIEKDLAENFITKLTAMLGR